MINFLKNELDKTILIANELKTQYSEEDARVAFFDGHFGIIKHYLNFYILLESELIVTNYKFIFDKPDISIEDINYHILGHKNFLNNQLIINSWSNFELCITLITQKILPLKQIEDLLNHDYNELLKILKNTDLDKNQQIKLEKTKKSELSHVPITRKYNKLFKLIAPDYSRSRNLINDRKFLEFYGKLRNCIHTNYIYYGKEYSYKFQNVVFTFINGQTIHQSKIIENVIINMSIELRNIFLVMVQNIDFKNKIRDPSFDLFEK